MQRIIYETKGKAREYAQLAVNVYMGCEHQCSYCYVRGINGQPAEAKPRKDILENLARQIAARDPGPDGRLVNLSFMSDPFPRIEEMNGLTRKVLVMLGEAGYKISVLTKAGSRAFRDFDIFSRYGIEFGQTIISLDEKQREQFEPGASPISERIVLFELAKKQGIKTWCSIEPVLLGDEGLAVIEALKNKVDKLKIGKINHNKNLESKTDWPKFVSQAEELLQDASCKFMFKESLQKFRE
jgi:DNA repair photolyase